MTDITVEELKRKIDNKEEFLLIDVREQWEYQEFNIKGQLIPLGTLQGAIDDIEDAWMDKEVWYTVKQEPEAPQPRHSWFSRGLIMYETF